MSHKAQVGKAPRRSWSNWLLLAGSHVITTSGLALALMFLFPSAPASWPWMRTDYVLAAACVFMVVTLVVYLSVEQRHMHQVNERFQAMRQEMQEAGRRRLFALLSVSRIIGTQSDLQHVFDCITSACRDSLPCDQASLMLFEPARKTLVVRAAAGHENPSKVLGSEKGIGEGVAGWVAQHRKPLILGGDHKVPPEIKLMSKALSAAIVVPIILRDELVGVISISSRSSGAIYEMDDLRALEVFAENAGACIRHAEQAEWMRKTITTLRDQLEPPVRRAPELVDTAEAATK